MPARVRRPKDKANVEIGVGVITRHAIAALRDRVFFSLGELNAALAAKVDEINAMQFAKKPATRSSVFESQEKEALSALPVVPFAVCIWERATVRSDYHVFAKDNFYSVPFEHANRVVDVRITMTSVEVFCNDVRIASHVRNFDEGEFVTLSAHMPENHRSYLEWNAGGLMKQAESIGSATQRTIALLMAEQETKHRSLGQGKSLLALAGRYGAVILEDACAKQLELSDAEHASAKAIEYLCKAAYATKGDIEDSGAYAILRGKDYYEKSDRSEQ
jgi:hypothetical protein